jgi:hypothetical protein
MLEGIGLWTVILGSKLHAVPPIKFTADLKERVVTATTEDQEWVDTYNAAKDGNSSANIEYLHRALYDKAMLWIPEKDDLRKTVHEVEYDSKIARHIGQDKTIKIIKHNLCWPGLDKYIKDLVRSCESYQHRKGPRYTSYELLSTL